MKNLFPYIYDFISVVFENKECRKYIKNIILFGSVSRDDFDEESDVDIFINVSEQTIKKVEPFIKDAEKRFRINIDKKWKLLRIETPIRYIVGDLETYMWRELKSEIISTGMILYGKYEGKKENLKHYVMFTYSLENLPQKAKMRFIRKFFGYKLKKDKKLYEHGGYIKEIGGKKFNNIIFVPAEKSREIQKLMNSFKITPEINEIWINEE